MEERRSGERRKKNRLGTKRWFALFLSLAVMVTMIPVAAVAAGPIDTTRPGSLKLIYKDTEKGTSLSGVKFDVYRVADDPTGYANYKPNDLFSGAGVSFDNLDAEGWRGAAGQLDGYVKLNQIKPDASMTTDENGECSLSSLHPGLFLVVGDMKVVEQTANDLKYTPQSILVSVPSYTDEVTKADWNYDVVLNVKFDREEVDKPNVSRRVVKVWEDKDGNAMAAPEGASITVQLLSNDRPYSDPVTLNAENNWTYTWTDLPALAKYTLAEVNVPANYAASVREEETSFIVTNKYTNELISIIGGEKKWDASITDRPESIKVKLMANGKETGDVVEVRPNENNLWLWSFKDKLKYDENGEEIDYSVAEEADGVYIPKVETVMGNPYDMTMTNLPSSDNEKMNLNVYKKWVGSEKGPDTIKVRLHSSADGTDNTKDRIEELKSPEWQYTFENLDVKDANGDKITYTITEETELAGYATTYGIGSTDSASARDKAIEDIANDNAKAVVSAAKSLANVTLTENQAKSLLKTALSQDLNKVTVAQIKAAAKIQGVTLSDEQAEKILTGLKSVDISRLKQAEEAATNEAVTVAKDGKSVSVDTAKVTADKPVEILITNRKLSLNVTKKWVGSEKGSNEIEVVLHSSVDGVDDQTVKLNEANSWKYAFKDLDVVDASGKEITYTITEKTSLSGYTTTYSGSTGTTATSSGITVDASKVTGDNAVEIVITNTSKTPNNPNTPTTPTTPTTPSNPSTPSTTGTTTNTKTTTTNTPKASEVTTKLPQTGMLWWPVPVCAAAGILFFTIGWALRRREEQRIESGK